MKAVRKLIALALSLALQVAAIGAPLVHSHPEEHATDHHNGPAVHAHWAGHRSAHHQVPDGPSLDDNDHDRAVYIATFIAVAGPSFSVPGVTQQVFNLPPSTERAAHRRIDTVRTHDPPTFRSVSPRAPPRFLS